MGALIWERTEERSMKDFGKIKGVGNAPDSTERNIYLLKLDDQFQLTSTQKVEQP